VASKALKGLTIKIGGDTSELTKSLDKVEKQGRSLSSELGQINKLLKMDPTNTELLAQKQKVLADAISNTESKLDTLKEAEKQAQEQFARGEISEAQYRALQREIIETEAKLAKYKKAAEDTADAVEDLGEESQDTAQELDNQADKTEDAEQATDDLDDSANSLAVGGLAAIAAAAAAAVTAIVALAEESREYRTEMAKLDTAFRDANFSAEAATKTYESLQGILGETDQAVEAANNLAALCTNEEELNDWTEILTGVYAKFGASLPVEGLAEAANETMRVGQVTGPLADALNWAAKEGADFGVVLKDNINFTELSKKELDQLTDAQRAEYEARKKQHDEIEAYNQKVQEAASAEDKFNIALENCANEQERQQLITKTLTKLYGSAATQYKKTNAEVIRANEATEKWNKATAKIGKAVEPVVTDIKELGVALLEDASGPLEDIADFIRKDIIPAIKSISSWVKRNLPTIKTGLAGVAAVMVTFKIATIAATVAQKGLAGAIKSTTVAQKALTLAQKASPWGWVAVGVAGVTAALVTLAQATKDAARPADVLTEEERELMKAADEAAEAFREQKKATDEALGNVSAEMGRVQKLADELRTLADESGRVAQKDRERAQLIINELNEALGTEYSMTGDLIQNYKDLKASIDDVIKSKLANSLTEAIQEDYIKAVQNEAAAMENITLKWEDYQNQIGNVESAEADYLKAHAEYNETMKSSDEHAILSAAQRMNTAFDRWEDEKAVLEDKKSKYDQAAQDYSSYYNTIAVYEEAQAAALSGNYQKAVDLLTKKASAYGSYSDAVDAETAKVLDTLYKEAVDAGLEAERTKKNFEKGVDGYTEEMVKEAETNYQKAMEEFANAYADAEGVGEDITEGMTTGAENKRSGLLEKARSLVSGFLAAAREAADSHSPSRKAIAIFEDIGEGAEIGVENKTKDVARAGTEQARALLDAYRAQEVNAQRSLRSIAEQQNAAYNSGNLQAGSTAVPLLEQILFEIEKGHVLVLDGDILVGATADRMDAALGRRRVLATRGAIK